MKPTSLFRLELRHVLRQRLTWLVLGLLLLAMLVGAATGAARVAAERATLDRVAAEGRDSIAQAHDAAARYRRPATYKVASFRDPTDAYGYQLNFLASFAVRPPGPLAALATGQSDLQPVFIRVNFANPFTDSTFELRSPRILALGAFDLAFVLVYLLPLGLIALGGTRLAAEQDSGTLRLIAAQPVRPRDVAAAKFGALAAVAVPVLAFGAPLALLVTGGIGKDAAPAAVALLILLVALYALGWIAACALAVSMWRGAVGALTALVLGWAALTVLLPSLAALALDIALPVPSRLGYVDASRAAADRLAGDATGAATWFRRHPDLVRINPAAEASAEVGRMAQQDLLRAALLPSRHAFEEHATRIEAGGTALSLLSPASLLDGALQRLAGTDAANQRRFTAAADAHAQALRRWFAPRVVAAVGRPPACASCPGRLTFAEWEAVPAFRPTATPSGAGFGIAATLYLAVVTGVLALLARRRFAAWPV